MLDVYSYVTAKAVDLLECELCFEYFKDDELEVTHLAGESLLACSHCARSVE